MRIPLSSYRELGLFSLPIVLSLLFLYNGTNAQSPAPKLQEPELSDKEHKEAVAFARIFWERLIQAKDIRPVLKQFAFKGFYECLEPEDLVFVHDYQIRRTRRPLLKRYYVAESNFLLLLMLSGINESDDLFSSLPSEVQKAFTKSTWDAVEQNDSDYDPEKPQTESQANKYFDRSLLAFERANPLLRKHVERNWAVNYDMIKKLTSEYEESASHAFEPTLWVFDKGRCGLKGSNRRFIAIDIPYFQLMLTKIDGRLRVVNFPFHVD